MSSKEKIIEYKLDAIDKLQQEIDNIRPVETGRLYKIVDNDWDSTSWGYIEAFNTEDSTSWGYIEAFNTESCRICVVATNNSRYNTAAGTGRHRKNIGKFRYTQLDNITRAKKEDLPLLLNLNFKSAELELIFKGKKRVKLD